MEVFNRMASLSQAKTLGGIGSILALLAFVPYAGWVLSIVGFVLVLVAVKYISDVLGDPSIFKNMIISVVVAIVGAIVAGVAVAGAIFSLLGFSAGLGQGATVGAFSLAGFVTSLIIGLVALWVLFIVSAIFLRRAYNTIAVKLNVGMFRTAALVYLIGAALIIVIIGFIPLLIAQILFIVAFFSIREEQIPVSSPHPPPVSPPPTMGATSTTQPTGTGSQFCIKCGARLAAGTTFCPSCGERQPGV